MTHQELLFAAWIGVGMASGALAAGAEERGVDLSSLASRLDLSESGVTRWLARLEADGPSVERLLAVTPTGEPLMERDGAQSNVVIGVDLDTLLFRRNRSVVLIHNHPSNTGLSAADIGQLARPGVAAVIAIGHDGSVFAAAPGARMDPDHLEEEQYARASTEVTRRLRRDWPADRMPFAVADAHRSHLVAQALAKTGVIDYWSVLRGTSRTSYEQARQLFAYVVAGTAVQLRR